MLHHALRAHAQTVHCTQQNIGTARLVQPAEMSLAAGVGAYPVVWQVAIPLSNLFAYAKLLCLWQQQQVEQKSALERQMPYSGLHAD